MAYRIFVTNDEGVQALKSDDLVGRQTLVIKEGKTWELEGKVIMVSGSDEALERAEAIIEDAEGTVAEEQERIKADIDAEEDAAAGGMGFVFG